MERLTKVIAAYGKNVVVYTRGKYEDTTAGEMEVKDVRNVMGKLSDYENTGLTPDQIMELKERDKPKRVVYEHEFEDNRLISYVQRCKSCGEQYDPSEKFNFCPNCGQRILRRKVIVKAFANYGFAGTEMEFEEEFPDNATDEEIEETMKDIVYEQVDWSWKKED